MGDARGLDPNSVISRDIARLTEAPSDGEIDQYWTEERMAAAEPFELRTEAEPEQPFRLEIPDSSPPSTLQESRGEPNSVQLDLEAPFTSAFDTARVGAAAKFPYSAVGKLFVRTNGVDRYGTAFVVGTRAIVTAGHCVLPGGASGWADQVAFAPRFDRGAPVGLWKAHSVHTLAGWAAQGPDARAFDLGGAILSQPISQVTGVIGWLANASRSMGSYHSVGYPIQWVSPSYPFDGSGMWRCIGRQLAASGVLRMANNMTEGASGGPWMIERDGNIYVNGLNSYRRSDEPNAMASPYFGAGMVNLMGALT